MISRIQLHHTQEQVARWAHVDPTDLWNNAVQPVLSHDQYPVLRVSSDTGKREIVCMQEAPARSYAHHSEDILHDARKHSQAAGCSCFACALRWRRCLVPSDVLNECRHIASGISQPCSFALSSNDIFGIAAVWDTRQNEHGLSLQSFSIITSEVTPWLQTLFEQMPVIVPSGEYKRWLQPSGSDIPVDLLTPLSVAEFANWKLTPCDVLFESSSQELSVPRELLQTAQLNS